MGKFVITTDSASDINQQLAKELQLNIVNLSVNIGEEEYDGVDKKIDTKEVFDLIKKGAKVTTSQVTPSRAENFFEKYLKDGIDILHIAFSSNLSGTYNSCKLAADNLRVKYPDRKITVIDSLCASLGQGLLVIKALERKTEGKSMDEIIDFVEKTKHHVCHIFTVGNLRYLYRGGRISKAEELIGTMIGIKPVMSCNDNGKLVLISKARGRQNSLISLVDYMEKTIGKNKNEFITISHGDSLEDAEFVAKSVKSRFGIDKAIIGMLGPVIGLHSGPETMALFYIGDYRPDKK